MWVIPNDELAFNGQGLYTRLWCTWEVRNCILWGIEVKFWPMNKVTEHHLFGNEDKESFTADAGHCGPP
jgi:hypothetical protein